MKSHFFRNIVPVRQIPLRNFVVNQTISALCILGGCGVALSAPATSTANSTIPSVKPAPAPSRGYQEYLMGAGDVLEITVTNHPDLNANITVRPDGRITLPRAGEFKAKGKTSKALGKEIQDRLERTLNNANVTVIVREARGSQARVIGAVNAAGAFSLRPGWRVMDLIAAAGGLSTKSNRIAGRIVRSGNVITLDINRANNFPSSNANLLLRPDDLVVLDAQSIVRQISVAGNVAKPGAYDLEEGLTVTGLLAQAGGPTPTASLRGAHVLRDGKQISLNLTTATGNDSTASRVTFIFQPGDVLVIPENQTRFGVLGQVARPAYFPVPEEKGEATLLKAIALAGGAAEDGDLAKVTITRTENGVAKTFVVDAAAMLKGTSPDTVEIQSDDIVFVPKKADQVHVVGQVQRPGSYALKDGMSLVSLISEAGNPMAGAALSKAYVLRDGTQLPVNLRALLIEGKMEPSVAGFKLRTGDVLVLPDGSDQIHINGQVAKPGPYNLDDGLTVYSLLAKAGNPLPTASLARAFVLRDSDRIQMDLRSVIGSTPDPVLAAFQFEPGDVLVVPENPLKFAVLGQVAKPSYYPFPENAGEATVLKAIGLAGGPLLGESGANLAAAGIVRTQNGQQTVIPVNLDDALRRGKPIGNLALQPDDILYIPAKGRPFRITDAFGAAGILGALR